jgi:hypothetical protein
MAEEMARAHAARERAQRKVSQHLASQRTRWIRIATPDAKSPLATRVLGDVVDALKSIQGARPSRGRRARSLPSRRRTRRLSRQVFFTLTMQPPAKALLDLLSAAVQLISRKPLVAVTTHAEHRPDLLHDPVRSPRKARGPNLARRLTPPVVVLRESGHALSTSASRLLSGDLRARPRPVLCT